MARGEGCGAGAGLQAERVGRARQSPNQGLAGAHPLLYLYKALFSQTAKVRYSICRIFGKYRNTTNTKKEREIYD